MKHYFAFEANNTSYRYETLAGVASFVTMMYIIVVNPAILETASLSDCVLHFA